MASIDAEFIKGIIWRKILITALGAVAFTKIRLELIIEVLDWNWSIRCFLNVSRVEDLCR
jgi:hypothetical protein